MDVNPWLPAYVTSEYLSSLVLIQGIGSGQYGGRCAIQEIRAWLDLTSGSDDVPDCVSGIIAEHVIAANDARASWRTRLVPLLPRIIGSVGSDILERRRRYFAIDWVVRKAIPARMMRDVQSRGAYDGRDTEGVKIVADRFRALPPVVSTVETTKVRDLTTELLTRPYKLGADAVYEIVRDAARSAVCALRGARMGDSAIALDHDTHEHHDADVIALITALLDMQETS